MKLIQITLALLVALTIAAPDAFATLHHKKTRHNKKHKKHYAGVVHPVAQSLPFADPQTLCLADNIYFEGRSEGFQSQVEIGYVTVQRTKEDGYPSTICGVVKQPGQFSWYNKRKSYQIKDAEAWNKALLIAHGVKIGVLPNKYKGATHFHAKRVHPRWKGMHFAGILGNHKFYRKKGSA